MTAAPGVAIVTGAGSGIGRAAALALQAVGWKVALAGRNMDNLAATASQAAQGAGFLPVSTDVTDPTQVHTLFERVIQTWGRVDLLFNNAGVSGLGIPIDRLTPRQWQEVVDVNLTGAFLCAQQAVRVMKGQSPRGGRIINNGSVSAHSPRPNSLAYTVAKHALTGLTKSISLDGRPFGIVCGQLDVGNVGVDETRTSRGLRQADGTFLQEPVIQAAEVAKAVVHMASLPLEANIQFMTLIPSGMPYIGRG